MGRIFKTHTDDTTEATLRAMHTQNTLDNYYEKGIGWMRTCIFTILGILITSAYELNSGMSVWENTIEWFWYKMTDFATWVLGD